MRICTSRRAGREVVWLTEAAWDASSSTSSTYFLNADIPPEAFAFFARSSS